MFYQEQPDGRLSNVYDVKVLNKTFEPVSLSLSLEGLNGEIQLIGDSLRPGPQGIIHGKFLVLLEPEEIKSMTIPLRITVQSGGKVVGNVTTTFLGRPSRK